MRFTPFLRLVLAFGGGVLLPVTGAKDNGATASSDQSASAAAAMAVNSPSAPVRSETLNGISAVKELSAITTGRSLEGMSNGTFQMELDDLNTRVSTFSKVHETNFTDWMSQCAYYFKRGGFGANSLKRKYSTYHLKNKPSGLCSLQLYVDFKGAVWNDAVQDVLSNTDLLNTKFEDIEAQLPPLSLPAFMSFPESAKDVVEIVKFANSHGKKVSIKNSGHSYTASSSKEDSIQINLRKYPQYSFTDVYECEESKDYTPLSGSDGACKLALARGKTAVARVGGGQGNDDIYRSVMDFNFAEPREKRYNVLGGADGMVGGGGGFMMGGGLGRGEERLYGSGADNVLELEMVLPDGKHVKFAPTNWEKKDGFNYPQTTQVKGKCNNNVDHDESKWEWIDCPDGKPFANVTFQDLWFAVRGGGGGTWGVVLSATHQLHELIPQFVTRGRIISPEEDPLYVTCVGLEGYPEDGVSFCPKMIEMITYMWWDFLIDLLWNPDNEIGVDEDLSRHCGSTSGLLTSNPILVLGGGYSSLNCHGHGIQQKFQDAWATSVRKSKFLLPGYGEDAICALENRVYLKGGYYDQWHRDKLVRPLYSSDVFYSPAGLYADDSGPEGAYRWPAGWIGAMIPQSFLATKSDEVFSVLRMLAEQAQGTHTLPYASEQDGMSPQAEVYHSGGLQTGFNPSNTWIAMGVLDLSSGTVTLNCGVLLRPDVIAAMEDEIAGYQAKVLSHLKYNASRADDFPGFTEYNHVFANNGGVLKADPTKPCPFMSTRKEKEEICLSVQETVWGTKNFKRLTAIKNGIDPDNIFDVHFGIGNNERAGPISDYCATVVDATAPPFPEAKDISSPSQMPPRVCTSAETAGPTASPEGSDAAEPTASPEGTGTVDGATSAEGNGTVSPTGTPSGALVKAWDLSAAVVLGCFMHLLLSFV